MKTKQKPVLMIFVGISTLFLLGLVTVPAASVNPFVPNLDSTGYKIPPNPYSYGQCVWFAWGRAYEKGVSLPHYGNAMDWYNKTNYPKGSSPQANSIAVWSGGSPAYGHVAYVERVDGDLVYINEANVVKPGQYDGTYKVKTTSQLITRTCFSGSTLSLRGYIYLPIKSAPTLIRQTGTPQVYHINMYGYKAWVPTANVFNSWSWNWNLIINVTQAQLNSYPNASPSTIVFKDGTFIKYNNDISIIQNGLRCQFANRQAYIGHGGNPTLAGVYSVNAFEYFLNAQGPTVYK